MTRNEFHPDRHTLPGDVLADEMRIANISFSTLMLKTGLHMNEIWDIRNGDRLIDQGIAERLDFVFGFTPRFWLNVQKNYNGGSTGTLWPD